MIGEQRAARDRNTAHPLFSRPAHLVPIRGRFGVQLPKFTVTQGEIMFRIPCVPAFAALVGLTLVNAAHARQNGAPQTLEDLKSAIEEVRTEHKIPGLAVAVADTDGPLWIEGLGKANIEHDNPVTPDTLFQIGSVGKMFIAFAALKLVEQGSVSLDDPIRELAPEVQFNNPWERTDPVRLVHLMEHTTGWEDMGFPEMAHNDPTPVTLEEAIHLYPRPRTSRWVLGTRTAYSNVGAGVAGYIVEKTAGRRYEDYITEEFFQPLGMDSATFFKPEDYVNRAARGYNAEGQPQPYVHLIYRPAGSISASISDMAGFLQFMLHRGATDNERLLSKESISRMETPKTTLGADKGITAGYGLYNVASGYGDHGVTFRGHTGGTFGSYAELTYSPALGSGFVILMTGDIVAQNKISNLIRGFLLRDMPVQTPGSIALPEKFRNLSGYYRSANPRTEFLRAFTDPIGITRFFSNEDVFHRRPLLGGWTSKDVAISEDLLVNTWSGQPAIAVVEDPLAGRAVQVGSTLHKEVSAFRVYGRLLFAACLILLSTGAILYTPFWVARQTHGVQTARSAVSVRLWPAVAGLLLWVYLAFVALVFPRAQIDFSVIENMATLTWVSGGFFATTVIYAVVSVAGLIGVIRHRKNGVAPMLSSLSILTMSMHTLANLYLASYGMVGFRSWI